MSFRPIQVAVVHDDYVCRTGLTTVFTACSDMEVQAMTLDDPKLLSSDVVVTDFDNGVRILATVQALQLVRPSPKVAIVANADREWQIRDALKHGASAFLLLGASAEELFVAVRTAHRGECHLSPTIASKLALSLATEPLTEREGQVLSLLTDGLCNKFHSARHRYSSLLNGVARLAIPLGIMFDSVWQVRHDPQRARDDHGHDEQRSRRRRGCSRCADAESANRADVQEEDEVHQHLCDGEHGDGGGPRSTASAHRSGPRRNGAPASDREHDAATTLPDQVAAQGAVSLVIMGARRDAGGLEGTGRGLGHDADPIR
jgi:DNA-binding NarL/FixJ family response regulator